MRATTTATTLAIFLCAWASSPFAQEVSASASTLTIKIDARNSEQLIEKVNRTHAEMAAKGFRFAAISMQVDDDAAVVTYTRD